MASHDSFRDALILTGPTGSGKTSLAIALAKRLGAEIVSMDSMAVYRGMDIGTAKPTAHERQHIAHHLVDVLDPWDSGSVAWWLKRAAECCRDISRRGKRALIVGGTPMYLKALLRGLFAGPAAAEPIRRRLEEEAREQGVQSLHDRLACADPVTAARVHPNDLRRIVRALEVLELTGRPISAWQRQWSSISEKMESAGHLEIASSPEMRTREIQAGGGARAVWLDLPRHELYERINRRVEEMFAAGLVEEVSRLRDLGRPVSREARQALGYKEVFAFLDGDAKLDETIVRVQVRSRNFAKRQISWFRHLPEVRPVSRELTATLWDGKIE